MEHQMCKHGKMCSDFEIKVIASDFKDIAYIKLHNLIKRWITMYNKNQEHHDAEITEYEDNEYIIITFTQQAATFEMELPSACDFEDESDHDDDTDSEDE
jgi:hypothetical protein